MTSIDTPYNFGDWQPSILSSGQSIYSKDVDPTTEDVKHERDEAEFQKVILAYTKMLADVQEQLGGEDEISIAEVDELVQQLAAEHHEDDYQAITATEAQKMTTSKTTTNVEIPGGHPSINVTYKTGETRATFDEAGEWLKSPTLVAAIKKLRAKLNELPEGAATEVLAKLPTDIRIALNHYAVYAKYEREQGIKDGTIKRNDPLAEKEAKTMSESFRLSDTYNDRRDDYMQGRRIDLSDPKPTRFTNFNRQFDGSSSQGSTGITNHYRDLEDNAPRGAATASIPADVERFYTSDYEGQEKHNDDFSYYRTADEQYEENFGELDRADARMNSDPEFQAFVDDVRWDNY